MLTLTIQTLEHNILQILFIFAEKCEIALAKAAKPENHEQIMAVRNKVKTLVDHINKVKDELYQSKDLASISEKYWRNVSIT